MGIRAVDALRPWVEKLVAVSGDPRVAELAVDVWPDLGPEGGPLAGIRTALTGARTLGLDGVFVLACDLPLVGPELVGRVVREWRGEDAVAPFGPRGPEPLCALYLVSALPSFEEAVRRGEWSPARVLARLRTAWLSAADAVRAAGHREPFLNVNTRSDRRRADAAWARRVTPR